jgi:hypothetical protein
MANGAGGVVTAASGSTKNSVGQKLKIESHLAINLKRKIKEL